MKEAWIIDAVRSPRAVGKPGKLVEMDDTQKIFTNPTDKRTEDYITGRFG